jgi:hypothetical protein
MRTATEALEALREILWPADDPGADWSPDTLEAIAEVMEAAGYGEPPPPPPPPVDYDEARMRRMVETYVPAGYPGRNFLKVELERLGSLRAVFDAHVQPDPSRRARYLAIRPEEIRS